MAKRFIDAGYFRSPYVRGLESPLKLLYALIICDCDKAGVWVKDLELASILIGTKVTDADFQKFIDAGKAVDLKNGKYFFPDFIEHQYPQGLSENNPAHKNIILTLKKYNLYKDAAKSIPSTSQDTTVIYKDKVMDKVIDKVIDKVSEKKQKFDFRAAMIESGYDATLVDEWLTVRKNKRLSNTQTAFELFITEANKVKVDKNVLLKMIVAQSWGGFKAAWYANEKKANTGATALLDNVDYNVKF